MEAAKNRIHPPYSPTQLANSKILEKEGVPYPVTASQPFVAGNPTPPHPTALPFVTSVNASNPFSYIHGFGNPIGDFPWAIKASFTNAKTAAAVGVAALVPSSL